MTQFCIVGTGFSGTATFVHLVNKLSELQEDLSDVTLITIDARPENGPGLPYSSDETLPSHLCNNQANKMAIQDNDFVDWMVENKTRIVRDWPHLVMETHPQMMLDEWSPDDDAFYPRQLFGHYLTDRFQIARKKALERGAHVKHYNGYRAVDGYAVGDRFLLVIEEVDTGEILQLKSLEKVLIATGHWTPKTSTHPALIDVEGVFSSPYPAHKIKRKIAALADKETLSVYVQGMGPSAIDAILTVTDQGAFNYAADGHVIGYSKCQCASEIKIKNASRSGFFPAARGRVLDYDFKFLIAESYEALTEAYGKALNLQDILDLIDAELMHATQGSIHLDDVLNPKFESAYHKLKHDVQLPVVNDLIQTIILRARRLKFYRHLNPDEKQRYDRTLDTHFIRTAVPIPLANAEKLLALMEAGTLETLSLGYHAHVDWQFDKTSEQAYFDMPGSLSRYYFDLVIDSSGQSFLLNHHPSSFVQSILKRGEAIPQKEDEYEPGGLALDGDETFRLIKNSTKGMRRHVSKHLYAFGVITRYWQNERNFAGAIMAASDWVADDWVQHFINQHYPTTHNNSELMLAK